MSTVSPRRLHSRRNGIVRHTCCSWASESPPLLKTALTCRASRDVGMPSTRIFLQPLPAAGKTAHRTDGREPAMRYDHGRIQEKRRPSKDSTPKILSSACRWSIRCGGGGGAAAPVDTSGGATGDPVTAAAAKVCSPGSTHCFLRGCMPNGNCDTWKKRSASASEAEGDEGCCQDT